MKKQYDEKDQLIREAVRKRLIQVRKDNNLTQTEFGKLFDKSKTTVGSWEEGLSLPDVQTLYRIAQHFGEGLGYMFGEEGRRHLIEISNSVDSEVDSNNFEIAVNKEMGLSQMWLTEGEKKLIEELRERGSTIDAKTLEEMFNTILRYHQEKNPIDTDKPQYYEIRLKHYFED